jgi:hypothetical protein
VGEEGERHVHRVYAGGREPKTKENFKSRYKVNLLGLAEATLADAQGEPQWRRDPRRALELVAAERAQGGVSPDAGPVCVVRGDLRDRRRPTRLPPPKVKTDVHPPESQQIGVDTFVHPPAEAVAAVGLFESVGAHEFGVTVKDETTGRCDYDVMDAAGESKAFGKLDNPPTLLRRIRHWTATRVLDFIERLINGDAAERHHASGN